MIPLIRLKRQLLRRLQAILFQLLHLTKSSKKYLIDKHNGRLITRINTIRLDGNEKLTAILEINMHILQDNSGLDRLGHICEHHVHQPYQEAVVWGFTGVVDYRDVCSLFSHVHQISAHSVREFDAIHHACWADYVRDVGRGCTGGCAGVEKFATWADSDFHHSACH